MAFGLADLLNLSLIIPLIRKLERKLDSYMATVLETLTHIDDKLTEASSEILKEIADLKTAVETAGAISPDVQAKMDSISLKAEALADVVPDAPSPTVDNITVADTGEIVTESTPPDEPIVAQ